MISRYYFQHHNFGRCAIIYTENEIFYFIFISNVTVGFILKKT